MLYWAAAVLWYTMAFAICMHMNEVLLYGVNLVCDSCCHFHQFPGVMLLRTFLMNCKMIWFLRNHFGHLRHCITSRKVTASIPDGVIGIFHWHNPSGRTMALGWTQHLTEMNTRNISWGQSWPVHRADNITIFMCQLSWNLGDSNSWNPQGLSRHVMGLLYLSLIIPLVGNRVPSVEGSFVFLSPVLSLSEYLFCHARFEVLSVLLKSQVSWGCDNSITSPETSVFWPFIFVAFIIWCQDTFGIV